MAYRVVMELMLRPDSIEEWIWTGGGKAWTAKLNSGDSIHEFASESDANTKMAELDVADSTNRRYKVIEV